MNFRRQLQPLTVTITGAVVTALVAIFLASACSTSSSQTSSIPPQSVNNGSACVDAGATCNVSPAYHITGDPCSGREVYLRCGDPTYFCCVTGSTLTCGERYCPKGNTCDSAAEDYCPGVDTTANCGAFACVGACTCNPNGGCDCPPCVDQTSTLGSKCNPNERYFQCIPVGTSPPSDAGTCRSVPVDTVGASFCCAQ